MKKKALIVYGGWEGHDPELVAHRFGGWLREENFDVNSTDEMEKVFADKDYLMGLNLIIPIRTQDELSDPLEYNVADAVDSGVGLAGCHGGMCDAFRFNVEWQWMTGATWVAHPGTKYIHLNSYDPDGSDAERGEGWSYTHYTVNFPKQCSSPLIEGLEDFDVFTEQYFLHIDPCINVLATTTFKTPCPNMANGEIVMPVAYTKLWGKGRIFYCSMGHHDDIFDIPQVGTLMRRGLLWAAK